METKKYYYNKENNLEDEIIKYLNEKKKEPDLKFVGVFSYEEMISIPHKKIIETCLQKGIKREDLSFTVRGGQYRYNEEEWERIKNLNEKFKKARIGFGFEDKDWTWTINEVENTNAKIVSTADDIKSMRLSPIEQILAVYLKVSNRKYIAEERGEHYSLSRSVYAVTNNEKIVCVGFAELMKAILDTIDNSNIQVYGNSLSTGSLGSVSGYHRNLIINVKDEKYGINGYYYFDPTWDCKDRNTIPYLNYFLIPLSDLGKFKGDDILDGYRRQFSDYLIFKPEFENERSINDKISFSSDGFRMSEDFWLNNHTDIESYNDIINLYFKNEKKEEPKIQAYKNVVNELKDEIILLEEIKKEFKKDGQTEYREKELVDFYAQIKYKINYKSIENISDLIEDILDSNYNDVQLFNVELNNNKDNIIKKLDEKFMHFIALNTDIDYDKATNGIARAENKIKNLKINKVKKNDIAYIEAIKELKDANNEAERFEYYNRQYLRLKNQFLNEIDDRLLIENIIKNNIDVPNIVFRNKYSNSIIFEKSDELQKILIDNTSNIVDVDTFFEEKIQSVKKSIEKYAEKMKEDKNDKSELGEYLKKFTNGFYKDFFEENSKPVECYKIQQMLNNVLKDKIPNEKTRCETVKQIVDYNIKSSKDCFYTGAKNAFREAYDLLHPIK